MLLSRAGAGGAAGQASRTMQCLLGVLAIDLLLSGAGAGAAEGHASMRRRAATECSSSGTAPVKDYVTQASSVSGYQLGSMSK